PIRAHVGDDVAFEQAAGVDTPASYEHYLAVGSRHAGEVKADRLPHARLRAATSLAALRKVRDDYAGTPVGKQAEAAIHAAYAGALDRYRTRAATGYGGALPLVEQLVGSLEAKSSPPLYVAFDASSTLREDEAQLIRGADLPSFALPADHFEREGLGP